MVAVMGRSASLHCLYVCRAICKSRRWRLMIGIFDSRLTLFHLYALGPLTLRSFSNQKLRPLQFFPRSNGTFATFTMPVEVVPAKLVEVQGSFRFIGRVVDYRSCC